MSREGAGRKPEATASSGGTSILVWVVYVLGILAATIFVFSLLFTLGALVLSDDVPVTYDLSVPALVVWGGLVVLAAGTWIVRRRR